MNRISKKFQELKTKKQSAFVAYICAGDPDYKTSLSTLYTLPETGVDIIEIGVPFLDPAGDGPIIEMAGKRAISGGMNLEKTIEMVREFRKKDSKTPIILMTYFNPVLKFGIKKIFAESKKSGVDGFLIVDLPLEEENEIIEEIEKNNLDLIRLIAPTTSMARAKKILKNASGFLYLISMMGITGTKLASAKENEKTLQNLRKITSLPIVIGFGIQNKNQAEEFSKIGADGVVIGSAIVKEMAEKKSSLQITESVRKKVAEFSSAIKR